MCVCVDDESFCLWVQLLLAASLRVSHSRAPRDPWTSVGVLCACMCVYMYMHISVCCGTHQEEEEEEEHQHEHLGAGACSMKYKSNESICERQIRCLFRRLDMCFFPTPDPKSYRPKQ